MCWEARGMCCEAVGQEAWSQGQGNLKYGGGPALPDTE